MSSVPLHCAARTHRAAPRPALSIRILCCMAHVGTTGAGESGKSTIFKQMKLIYGVGFTEEERVLFTHVVHNNVIASMRNLVQACEDYSYDTSYPVGMRAGGGGEEEETWVCVWWAAGIPGRGRPHAAQPR